MTTTNADDKVERQDHSGRVDYDNTAFFLGTPSIGTLRRLHNRAEHQMLLATARRTGVYVWYADVRRDDGRCYVQPPYLVDWDSVPDKTTPPQRTSVPLSGQTDDDDVVVQASIDTVAARAVAARRVVLLDLNCPYCGKQVHSAPGRTNHVKAKHPEKYDDYIAGTFGLDQ